MRSGLNAAPFYVLYSVLLNIFISVIKMMNYIWGGMILLSFAVSLFTGRVEETAAAATAGAASAIESCISLLGIMCLWTGLAKIGEKSGIINFFSHLLRPVTRLLFPNVKSNSPAMSAIVMNIVANLMGMGNAATPLGINAIKELHKENKYRPDASNDMCMFIVINTASIQLLPATLISMRQSFGSANPGEVIVPVWIVSIIAVVAGVIVAKILEKRTL